MLDSPLGTKQDDRCVAAGRGCQIEVIAIVTKHRSAVLKGAVPQWRRGLSTWQPLLNPFSETWPGQGPLTVLALLQCLQPG